MNDPPHLSQSRSPRVALVNAATWLDLSIEAGVWPQRNGTTVDEGADAGARGRGMRTRKSWWWSGLSAAES
jgi:hypothetical protein